MNKIVDEQKSPEEITEFQIQDAKESAEAIQDRLQKLYAEGMDRFLKERIVYISRDQIEKVLKRFPNQSAKDRIMAFSSNRSFTAIMNLRSRRFITKGCLEKMRRC
jgi:hypothetical protein